MIQPFTEQELSQSFSELRLLTNDLERLHAFYEEVLDLPVEQEGEGLTVTAGSTRIRFERTDSSPAPFYHIAFNIPENKLEAARLWQQQRSQLLLHAGKEVIHFKQWNAHSIFFKDPAGNILEHIARHNLDNATGGAFSSSDILSASEIGVVVEDVLLSVEKIQANLGLPIFQGKSETFTPVGTEHGLLIVVQRARPWFPEEKDPADIFPLHVQMRGWEDRSFSSESEQLAIHLKSEG